MPADLDPAHPESDRVTWREHPERAGLGVATLGSGEALVLIPPAQGSLGLAMPLARELARRFTVHAIVLPGEAGHRPIERSLRESLDDVRAALDLAGVTRANMMGTSYGGTLALMLALDDPARVSRLVLNVTTAKFRNHALSLALARRFRNWPLVVAQAVHLVAAWRCRREVLALVRDGLPACKAALGRFRAAPRTPARTLGWRILAMAEIDVEERLGELRMPVLIVRGDGCEGRLDGLMPRESQRALLSRIRHATTVAVEGAGHLAVITRPERLAAVVTAFIRGHD